MPSNESYPSNASAIAFATSHNLEGRRSRNPDFKFIELKDVIHTFEVFAQFQVLLLAVSQEVERFSGKEWLTEEVFQKGKSGATFYRVYGAISDVLELGLDLAEESWFNQLQECIQLTRDRDLVPELANAWMCTGLDELVLKRVLMELGQGRIVDFDL